MKKPNFLFLVVLLLGAGITRSSAQTASASDYLVTQPTADRIVPFSVTDEGISKPIIWGLDLAWLSKENVRRGMAFMNPENVDIIRSSFTPTAPLVDGELAATELRRLNERLDIIALLGRNMNLSLNCDHPSVDNWFKGNAAHWAQLIDVTARLHEERGHTIVTVAPFNEPDYTSTGQGNITDFYNIAGELKNNPRFANTRISGGNTLNNDKALEWYNTLKGRLDEGNTHQLAGGFDSYAGFFTAVRANGHHATNDELHNVMEAMVGVEYGMQTGIWWGTAEYARGEFVKASDGQRLAYAEHRPNWTAASVYRAPDGKIQAFGGTSERQAATTSYRFLSKDRDVYYNGYGPQREYVMELPGGTGYQVGQTNAEGVVNVTWGDDIQPVIDGRYVIVNRNSRKVMDVAGGATTNGAGIQQNTFNRTTSQRWDVTPVELRVGGDFSYFSFVCAKSSKSLDILNWSLENGGSIIQYDHAKGNNQQWYLEYAEDGWFYIRSRHSAKCLEVSGSSTTNGASIVQRDKTGAANQQWRFLPIGASVELTAPAVPAGLVATPNQESIRLEWTANTESDLAGYTVFRTESEGGPYNTIARNVTATSFVDNTTVAGKEYFYAIKAVDNSLNRSGYSNEVSATATGGSSLIAQFSFEGDTRDKTVNLNHSALAGEASFIEGKVGAQALEMDGAKHFLQLPATLPHYGEITVAAWIYWKGGNNWQRIFDFGNGENEYIFLTARSDAGQIRLVMKNGGEEQRLNIPLITSMGIRDTWSHIAVTLSSTEARIYLNGKQEAESTSFTINPMDFKPVLNYIGRSQYAADPLFKGNIDDFRVYNYALSASEIAAIADNPNSITEVENGENGLTLWPLPANDVLHVSYPAEAAGSSVLSVYNVEGQLVLGRAINGDTELDVSGIPAGMYILKLTNEKESLVRKFIIKR